MEKPFLSGVIEGFYGRPWTAEQRMKLFSRLKKLGLNIYLYAPKDDNKHRVLWRDLYNVEETDVLSALVDASEREGVEFVYAISPGLDVVYSSTTDINCLKRKLDQVQRLGCHSFALLFDDIKNELPDADRDTYQSLGLAQVALTNEIFQHLNQPRNFLFCPTEYCTSRARPNLTDSAYLGAIGSKLLPPIDILWTGPKVVSRKISIQSIEDVTEVLQRPPLIWDNLHANDYDYSRVFLGPFEGRSSELRPYVRGVLANPNREFEANFMALHTLSQWAKCSVDCVKKDIILTESPLPTEVLQLETDGDFVPDEDNLIHCCTQPYIPRQALKIAISEWHDEFLQRCDTPDDLSSNLTPLLSAPPFDPSLPKSGNGLPGLPPPPGGEPMDCCVTMTSNGSSILLSAQDDETAAGETMQIDSDATPTAGPAATLEDVTLLVDLFYLPFEYGRQTVDLLNELDWIISNIGHREWTERQGQMIERLVTICRSLDHICDIPNRAIFAEIYPYLWATKIVISILICFLQWIGLGKVPSTCQCFVHGPATWSSQEYQCRLSSGDFEPWLTKGGVIRELQKMLPFECNSDLHFYSCPPPSDSAIFAVRPYRASDKDAVCSLFKHWYTICINNDVSTSMKERGLEFEMYSEIMVESFLHHSPEFCFVVEDTSGAVCAYVLSAVDTAAFYEKVKTHCLPEIIKKYEDITEKDANFSSEEVIQQFEAYKTCLLDNQASLYPSLLRIEFNPELLSDRSALKRAVSCAIAALKINGSSGVYTRVPILHPQFMEVYYGIGLCEIGFRNTEAAVLGRSISVFHQISTGSSPSSCGSPTTAKWCHMCYCCSVI